MNTQSSITLAKLSHSNFLPLPSSSCCVCYVLLCECWNKILHAAQESHTKHFSRQMEGPTFLWGIKKTKQWKASKVWPRSKLILYRYINFLIKKYWYWHFIGLANSLVSVKFHGCFRNYLPKIVMFHLCSFNGKLSSRGVKLLHVPRTS